MRSIGKHQAGRSLYGTRPVGYYGAMRKKLDVSEQIAVLKKHGVTFNLYSEEKAAQFLEHNTYFFKLKAFENNFNKTNDRAYSILTYMPTIGMMGLTLHILPISPPLTAICVSFLGVSVST